MPNTLFGSKHFVMIMHKYVIKLVLLLLLTLIGFIHINEITRIIHLMLYKNHAFLIVSLPKKKKKRFFAKDMGKKGSPIENIFVDS